MRTSCGCSKSQNSQTRSIQRVREDDVEETYACAEDDLEDFIREIWNLEVLDVSLSCIVCGDWVEAVYVRLEGESCERGREVVPHT